MTVSPAEAKDCMYEKEAIAVEAKPLILLFIPISPIYQILFGFNVMIEVSKLCTLKVSKAAI